MRTVKQNILGAVFAGLALACGDAIESSGYRGEVGYKITGTVAADDRTLLVSNLKFGILWELNDDADARGLYTAPLVSQLDLDPMGPFGAFSLGLLEPPPVEALAVEAGGLAAGYIVAFADQDGDGVLDCRFDSSESLDFTCDDVLLGGSGDSMIFYRSEDGPADIITLLEGQSHDAEGCEVTHPGVELGRGYSMVHLDRRTNDHVCRRPGLRPTGSPEAQLCNAPDLECTLAPAEDQGYAPRLFTANDSVSVRIVGDLLRLPEDQRWAVFPNVW